MYIYQKKAKDLEKELERNKEKFAAIQEKLKIKL